MVKYELESKEEFLEFAIDRLNDEDNISLIVLEDNIEIILDCREFECKSLIKEINAEYCIYVITKNTVRSGIYLEITPVTFDEDCIMENYIENDLVAVQDGLLDDEELLDIDAEELIILDYEYDNEETCNCECCQGCCDNNEEENEPVTNEIFECEDVITAKLEFIEDTLENYGEISLITNYETAKEIAMEYGIHDYLDYFAIDLQSDVEGYLVEITEDELFVIEPIERIDGYFTIETDRLYIDFDVEEYLDEDFYENYLNVEECLGIKIQEVELEFSKLK